MTAGAAKPLLSDRMLFAGLPVVCATLLFLLELTDIDRQISDLFYSRAAGGFPLRYDTFLEVVLHHWGKYLVALICCLAIAGLLLSYVVHGLRAQRRMLLFIALSLALAPATVSVLKHVSNKHCPWDIQDYGGMLPYTRLLDPSPDAKPGRCFPAGHASAGFALFAFYFAGRARGRGSEAAAGLCLGLGVGGLLGLGRMAQGAHFLSHTLWSALICWTVIALLYVAILRPSPARTIAPAR
jgi:membrane-associated PAP2 superfamily phosphatase